MSDHNLLARTNELKYRVDALTREQSASERDALAAAQSRADSMAAQFGTTASQPIPGESSWAYRKRVASKLQGFSERLKSVRLDSLDAPTFTAMEGLIYQDAAAAARNPGSYQPGELRAVVTQEGGRTVTRYNGDIGSWMDLFASQGVVGRFNRKPNGNS